MKICHLTSVHSYKDTRIFIKECHSLTQAGYEVHFVAPEAPNTSIDGVHIHGVVKEAGNRFNRMTKLVKSVYKKGIEIDADIYHFHDPELIPIGLKLKRRGKKVIYDVHEDVPRQILTKKWLPKYTHSLISKVFERYENQSAIKLDAIVAATPFIRDRFLKLGCRAQDVNNYPLLDELNIEVIHWGNKEDAICYVGGISFIRGIKEMVEALQNTQNVHMLLAGTFAVPREKEVVTALKGWEKVNELGFLNRSEVRDTYAKSKAGMVVLHPTINYIDALPVKMFEYMAAGIPVIASNFPLWEEIILKNKCGLCLDPLKPKKIADAITWIMENPDEAEIMGKNGRHAVETKYNWEIESKKLIEVYSKLANIKN